MRAPVVLLLGLILAAPAFAARRALDEAEIRSAVEDAARKLAAPGTVVEVRQVPRLVTDDADGVAVVDVTLTEAELAAGVRAVPVGCRVGNRVVSRGLATIAVRCDVSVWVTTRKVAAGETLAAADVRQESRPFDRPPSRELLSAPEPGRWTVRHALEADAVLRTTDLKARPDVASGAQISLVARAGSSAVSVPAIVRRAGNVGETILAVNTLTGDVVEAVLVDARTAELTRVVTPRRRSRASSGGETP